MKNKSKRRQRAPRLSSKRALRSSRAQAPARRNGYLGRRNNFAVPINGSAFVQEPYRALLHGLPAAIYTTDAEGRVMFFNEAAAQLWGRRPVIGQDLWCGSLKILNLDGTELPLSACPMAITLKSGVPVQAREILIERPNGTRRIVLPHPEPIRDHAGRIIGVIDMLVDVTDHKSEHEAARRLAAIVESSDDAIVGKDLKGIVRSWNEGAERIFGYAADEIIGKPITVLIPPDRQTEEVEILARISRGERIKHFETVRRRKDGELIDVDLTISPVKDGAGRIIGASKIARDITERRRTEARQSALFKLLSTVNRGGDPSELYEAALDAVLQCQRASRASLLLFDPDGVMRFKAWRGLSTAYRQAVEGHSPWKQDDPSPQPVFIADTCEAKLEKSLANAVKQEGIRALAFIPIAFEQRLFGKFMIYYDAPRPFKHEDVREAETIGNQIAFALERKRVLEESSRACLEAQRASRAKDDFLATLSHELRTPLGPALLLASEAALDPSLPPSARSAFDTIRKSIELEARLIDDMLDLTRVAHGKLVLKCEPVDAHQVLRDVISTVQADVELKRIRLTLNLKARLSQVSGDIVRLQQVFWNVLKNAVKFTPEKGAIAIETRSTASRLSVRISDTGVGLAPDELESIFETFSQGEDGAAFGGLGLGLAISRKLIEQHKGTITASSAGKGSGSTFTIELPLLVRAELAPGSRLGLAPSTVPVAKPVGDGVRVLLVEDHEPTRMALAHLLARRNYTVKAAGSVSEARSIFQRESFNLLIADIGLPDGTGFDLMSELRGRNVKGIALTGYGMEQDVERSRSAGFVAHLTKPIRIQSLDTALAGALMGSNGNGHGNGNGNGNGNGFAN